MIHVADNITSSSLRKHGWVGPLSITICIALMLAPLNSTLVAELRFFEPVFILACFCCFRKTHFNLYWVSLVLLFLALYVASAIVGFIKYESSPYVFYGFLYKYVFLIGCAFMGFASSSDKVLFNCILKTYLLLIFFLVGWVYYYNFILLASSVDFMSSRVSFPGSAYEASDAHLYSFVLGFMCVFYVVFLRRYFNHPVFVYLPFLLAMIVALILTGSRTAFVGLAFCAFGWFITKALSFNTLSVSVRSVFLAAIAVVVAILVLHWVLNDEYFNYYIQRAFNFDLSSDLSSLSRLEKLSVGLLDYSGGIYLLGIGAGAGTMVWYDGIVPAMLVHVGPLGLSAFIAVFSWVFITSFSSQRTRHCSWLALYVFVSCLATEYVLVSRAAFLVVFPLFLVFANGSSGAVKAKYLYREIP